MILHKDFTAWARDNGINLDHPDDYLPWHSCWANGFNTALRLYSIWKDGEQKIGCLEKNINEILLVE